MLLLAGLCATAVAALALAALALEGEAAAPFPAYGWWGIGALAVLELLLALRQPEVATFFTALAWTAYIAIVDAAVHRRRGKSLFSHGGSFAALWALSIPAWLLFELYNLHLRNWIYVGVPGPFWNFAIGAAWAFATIFPGVFETADLIHCGWAARLSCRPWRQRSRWPWVALGAVMAAAPLVAPAGWASYLFAPVWGGWVLMLDPVHRRLGWPSLLEDLEGGQPGRTVALLLAGAACGFFWEFWNYWALARWWYVFPILKHYRVFAMPAPGFLGFPPFALECFTLYVFLSQILLPARLRASLMRTGPSW